VIRRGGGLVVMADDHIGAALYTAALLIGLPSVAGLAGPPLWARPSVPQAAARLFLFVPALRVRTAFLAAPGRSLSPPTPAPPGA